MLPHKQVMPIFLITKTKEYGTEIVNSVKHIQHPSSLKVELVFVCASYDISKDKEDLHQYLAINKTSTRVFIFAYDPLHGKSPNYLFETAIQVCNSLIQSQHKQHLTQSNCYIILAKSNHQAHVSQQQANSLINTMQLVLPTVLPPPVSHVYFREYQPNSKLCAVELIRDLNLIYQTKFDAITPVQLNHLIGNSDKEQLNDKEKHNQQQEAKQQQFFVVHKNNKAKLLQKQDIVMPKPFDVVRSSLIRQSVINDDEVLHMRIPSDEIVCKQEDSLSLAQSITCPICLLIFEMPYYQCEGCSNGFCILCLESWWKKSPKTCAFKCKDVEFKQVKRSNTYNAVISILKIKCPHCKQEKTIADLPHHILKVCPEVDMICRFCQTKLKRKDIQQHEEQICLRRPWKCEHCEIQYYYQQKQLHLKVCGEVVQACSHEGCGKQVKRKDYNKHSNECEFRRVRCEWCEQTMSHVQYVKHEQFCDKKTVQCNWCAIEFKVHQSIQHELSCQHKKQGCRLCGEPVLVRQLQNHKIQCMFQNIILIKNKNESFENENIRLKQKIMVLQGCIEQSIANRESSTMKVVSQMRERDKKIVEKDLLRLDNSIRSVQKLRKQEVSAHMKFPHLIQSWCPICKELDKKFRAMLEPLFDQRKQVLTKLTQMQRYSFTPK